MARKFEKDNKFILYQVLYIIIISIMVYKGAELNLQKVTESDNSDAVPIKELLKTQEIINMLQKKLENTTDKKEADALRKVIQQLQNEKKKLENTLSTLSISALPASDTSAGIRVFREDDPVTRIDPRDTLFSGPPIFNTQPLYMNSENTVQNRSKAVLKITDADNLKDEIVSTMNPSETAKFHLGKKNLKHLAVVWKDKDSVIYTLNLLEKPEPTVSFSPSISQSERKVNARTNSTVSLLRVKSVRPEDVLVEFKYEPEIGAQLLHVKREVRSDEAVFQFTFNFKSRSQLENFIDKYEDGYYDSNKNNYFIRIKISVYDKVTEKKFDNLEQAFKVFFYRYE